MILEKIINQKKEEVAVLYQNPPSIVETTSNISFLSQLEDNQLHLIAEVKKASPSKGIIYNIFNPTNLAKTFESFGASCISVLTDREFFQGSSSYLMQVKDAVSVPVLRKDFIIDPIQVLETKEMGADVMLLILDILSISQANELIEAAHAHHIEILLELHGADSLKKLDRINQPEIIGVNNRNLNTFDVNMNQVFDSMEFIREVHPQAKIIAESGYQTTEQLKLLEKRGVNGVLIGEGLSKNHQLLEWFHHES